jgi:hypothetical protein
MAEDGIDDALTKEVGGVPIWMIGAAVGVLAAGGYWLANRGDGATIVSRQFDPNSEQPEAGEPDDGLPYGAIGDYLRENPGSSAYPIGGRNNGLPSPITNGQWARYVVDQLLATGADPTVVQNAIAKFIGGSVLSDAEESIVRGALQRYGSTPEGSLQIKKAPPAGAALTAPTGLKGTAWGKTTLRFSWNTVPGALGYMVYVNGVKRSATLWNAGYVAELKPNTTYRLTVAALRSATTGPQSAVLSMKTKP